MIKQKGIQPGKSRQREVESLLTQAEEQLPGVLEMLHVYGGYEEMTLEVQQYLEATQPQPFIETSNQSYPER